jgi:hypothetical protein
MAIPRLPMHKSGKEPSVGYAVRTVSPLQWYAQRTLQLKMQNKGNVLKSVPTPLPPHDVSHARVARGKRSGGLSGSYFFAASLITESVYVWHEAVPFER